MRYVNQIRIEGFRRLLSSELELRPLTVLIGANASGKTSLLDVYSLLAASASGGLKNKISELGGVGDNVTTDLAERMRFELSVANSGHDPLAYKLALAPTRMAYEISEETLTQQTTPTLPPATHIQSERGEVRYYDSNGGLVRPNWDHSPLETSLAQVPKMFREAEDFRKWLASSTYYHTLDVGPRSPLRLPQPMRPADLPGANGEDLVSCLYSIRETDRDRFELIEETLHAGFHDFQRLDFPPVAAGTLAMTWRDNRFSKPFYTHQLSEGALRFLWLVTLLQSPGLPPVTLIDEPEVSLHPELLSLLADLLREAALRTQLIVATHAEGLVRFLRPEEVVALDLKSDGTASATWADRMDLEVWLKDYTLDEVWRHGQMGAPT